MHPYREARVAGEPILVVDDNAINLQLLVILLRTRGYEVRTAGHADELRTSLAAGLPRLILMDLQLPGVDGLTLTRELKAKPATAHIPIVAVTAYAMKGDEQKALEAGCDGYVGKPIDLEALLALVARLLA